MGFYTIKLKTAIPHLSKTRVWDFNFKCFKNTLTFIIHSWGMPIVTHKQLCKPISEG